MFRNATEMRRLTNEPFKLIEVLEEGIEFDAKMGKHTYRYESMYLSKEAMKYAKEYLEAKEYKVGVWNDSHDPNIGIIEISW